MNGWMMESIQVAFRLRISYYSTLQRSLRKTKRDLEVFWLVGRREEIETVTRLMAVLSLCFSRNPLTTLDTSSGLMKGMNSNPNLVSQPASNQYVVSVNLQSISIDGPIMGF